MVSSFARSNHLVSIQLYSTADDPKMDNKWSSTLNDPQHGPQMIPYEIEEWNES